MPLPRAGLHRSPVAPSQRRFGSARADRWRLGTIGQRDHSASQQNCMVLVGLGVRIDRLGAVDIRRLWPQPRPLLNRIFWDCDLKHYGTIRLPATGYSHFVCWVERAHGSRMSAPARACDAGAQKIGAQRVAPNLTIFPFSVTMAARIKSRSS
jgi:hypothetical protein